MCCQNEWVVKYNHNFGMTKDTSKKFHTDKIEITEWAQCSGGAIGLANLILLSSRFKFCMRHIEGPWKLFMLSVCSMCYIIPYLWYKFQN